MKDLYTPDTTKISWERLKRPQAFQTYFRNTGQHPGAGAELGLELCELLNIYIPNIPVK